MRSASLCLGVLLAGLGQCSGYMAPRSHTPAASASAIPIPIPPYSLRSPAAAIVADAQAGLPLTGAADHLTAPQAAHEQADEVAALAAYSGFGWDDASSRSWAISGRELTILVVLTLRVQGSIQAYRYWMAAAARAPMVAGDCPEAVAARLDSCTLGSGQGRSLLAGRLGPEVFTISGTAADVERVAPLQAERLRD